MCILSVTVCPLGLSGMKSQIYGQHEQIITISEAPAGYFLDFDVFSFSYVQNRIFDFANVNE
jgi:hypothetical protein